MLVYILHLHPLYIRTVLKVKPFPEQLPITIATYEKAEENMEPELSKVIHMSQLDFTDQSRCELLS